MHLRRAIKQETMARAVAFGTPIPIDPATALLEEIHRSAGIVAWLNEEIGKLGGLDDLVYATELGFRPRAFLDVYLRERDHLARTCKMALDAGVAERQVRLAEEQGMLVAQAIKAVLKDLGLTAEQQELAPSLVRRHLLALPTARDG